MTGIEIIAVLGLLWGVFTYTDEPEPQCYVVTSEEPYAAKWVNESEVPDDRCELKGEKND